MTKKLKTQLHKLANHSTETFYIYTENLYSQFARSLQESLSTKIKERVLRSRLVRERSFIITPPQQIKDKLEQLTAFKAAGISCPVFADNPAELVTRLGDKLDVVFARTSLRGTQGEGIVQVDSDDSEWPRAPLYVEYIPKAKEYRFHVLDGKVIDVQEKRKKRDFSSHDRDPRIRNVDNGYTFCRGDVQFADTASTLAIAAVYSLDYFYGAVDIIYSKKRDTYYVLEVNSKPGMDGSTPDIYANAIIDRFNLTRIDA